MVYNYSNRRMKKRKKKKRLYINIRIENLNLIMHDREERLTTSHIQNLIHMYLQFNS